MQSHADSPMLFNSLDHLWLRAGRGQPRRHALVAWREHQGRVLMTLSGIGDRNAAEGLRGMDICLRREELPEPDPGQVYLHDIIGFGVVLEDGTALGPFTSFLETPGGAVWIIRHPQGEVMLPAVDEVVLSIDMDQRTITVRPPEGLLDLYLKPDRAD